MLWLLIDAAQSIESLTKHSGRSVVTSVSYLAMQGQHFNGALSTSELPSPEHPRVTLDSQQPRVTTENDHPCQTLRECRHARHLTRPGGRHLSIIFRPVTVTARIMRYRSSLVTRISIALLTACLGKAINNASNLLSSCVNNCKYLGLESATRWCFWKNHCQMELFAKAGARER